ncbi:MAG: transglycosylase domain-containing protein [bacterium]
MPKRKSLKNTLPRKKVPEPPLRPITLLKAKLARLHTRLLGNKNSKSRLLKYRFHGIPYLYLAFLIFFLLSSLYFLRDLPSPKNLEKDLYPISTEILDRHGQLLYKIYADENRTPIKLADLPPFVADATIAIEDKNFYHHHGFDTGGILRAAYKTLTGQRLEGGSTITQQLVKVALLSPERTVSRKIKEAVLALLTEILYSKDQILEMYLNHIPYGGTSYGIEAAAHRFFNKDARNLSLEEAALLAGLPQAPSRYSPFGNPDSAKNRQAQVLDAMVQEKYLTTEAALAAKNQTLAYAPPETNIRAPHFVMYVKEFLENKYGIQQLEKGGLRVTTSLDLDLQEAAQASLSAEIASLKKLKVTNGAALITNPETGEILAMVGSRDYFDPEIDGKVNVTTRLRQPGSSIKPLNYALGLETKVITPSTMLLDIPVCFQVDNQPDYCPKNYDNTFRGPVQIRFALGNSYNIPAVKVLALNGLENFVSFARKMGIQTWTDPSKYGLSLTLGGGEVTMTDMAVAFGVFANSGTKVPLSPILKVEDYHGNVLEEYLPAPKQEFVESSRDSLPSVDNLEKVLSPQTAFLISHILSDNNARSAAFGSSSVLNIPHHTVSVKTGTTNNLRDNWTIGYTSSRLVAVWVGNNDNTPMSYVASGITGASPIWQDLMKFALRDLTPTDLYKPPTGIEGASVCSDSGVFLSAEFPCSTRYEYFLDKTTPTTPTVEQREIWINRDTHHPPLKPEEFDNVELQTHLLAKDPFSGDYCLDCETYPEGYEPPALLIPFSTFVKPIAQ